MVEALYVHIPFCNKICTYCDFYKMVAKVPYKTEYIKHLVEEIKLKEHMFSDLKTIYIGGGTPSALPLNLIDYFLYHLTKNIDLNKVIEFTIEANPIDITDDFVKLVKKYGVNRISLGVQSFDNDKLKFLGREHNSEIAENSVKTIKRNGINNINIDIIYATPNDSFKRVKQDLKKALSLNVNHISTYSLILEEKTQLYHKYLKEEFIPFDQDIEYKIYYKIKRFLKFHGFNHYETSNFAKPSYEGIHNQVYWTNEKYLGIGAGASYYIDNVRYTNIMNIKEYFEGVTNKELRYAEKIEITKKEAMQEEMILGLRLIKGIDINHFYEKFNISIFEAFPIINNLLKMKQLQITKNNRLIIPYKYLYLSNAVLRNFI